MGEVRFMISEAAKQVDVESHVLRYWEEELGLKIGRTEMGHRYYTDDDIQLFRCIKKLKDEGMMLKDLKAIIPELKETRLKLRSPGAAQSSAAGPAPQNTPAAAAREDAAPAVPEIDPEKLKEARAVFGALFREILRENNGILKNDISSTVTGDVVREIDFLLQAKERQQEEHFRKLDSLIRQQQTHRKEAARSAAVKLKKLFLPS